MKRIIAAFLALGIGGAIAGDNVGLYLARLDSLSIPQSVAERVVNDSKNGKSKSNQGCVYVELISDNCIVWRSSAVTLFKKDKIEDLTSIFFNAEKDDNSFALFWNPGRQLRLSVNVTEEKVRSSAMMWLAGAGVAVGGGILTLATGGTALPAVALCAGGLAGGAGGAVACSVAARNMQTIKGAREICSIALSSDHFALSGTHVGPAIYANGTLQTSETISVTFSAHESAGKMAAGKLEKRPYLVQVSSLRLSSRNPDVKDDASYYMEVFLSDEKKPLVLDLGRVKSDQYIINPIYGVIQNQGGVLKVRIRRVRKMWKDSVVIEGGKFSEDGTDWLFTDMLTDPYGSCICFETFSLEQAE